MTEEATTGGAKSISRRELVKRAGVGVGGLVVSGSVAGSALGAPRISVGADASNTIKLGFVSPITGATSGFGEPDPYVLSLARKAFANGLKVGGTTYAVQIVNRDSQSSPSQAAKVANDLIHGQSIDVMLATSTPETVNPVADASEAAGVPYITTVVPWEAWYFGRGAKDPTKSPFRYGFHFCFGTHNFADSYTHLWPQVKTNKTVGVMWPNDADGNAIRASLGPLLEQAGYKIVDPGAYQDGTTDYTAQISKFKSSNCQIFNTFPIPPDFATFWRQAAQQGYTKMVEIAQIAKTGLFPSQVTALGSLGNNVASAVYWHPTWPYSSSLTGLSSKALAAGYIAHSGKQWNQQAGPSLALFDVVAKALVLSGNPKDKNAVVAAMKKTRVESPMGVLDWTKARPGIPFNVVPTPIPGGQWVKTGDKYKIDFVICEHSDDPKIPIGGRLKAY
jgi:branched-chain amino acid transport system substrate-binding protein